MNPTIIISTILLLIILLLLSKNREEPMTNTEAVNSLVSLYKDGKFKAESLDVSNNINIAKNIMIGIQPDTEFLSIAPIGTDSFPDYTKALNIDLNGNIFKPANRAKFIEISDKKPIYDYKPNRFMSIGKIIILDVNGVDVARKATVKQTEGTMLSSGQYGAVDSIIKYEDNTKYFHSDTSNNTLLLELEKETDISQIILYGRPDGAFFEETNNVYLTLLDENKNVKRVIHTGNWSHINSKEFILQ